MSRFNLGLGAPIFSACSFSKPSITHNDIRIANNSIIVSDLISKFNCLGSWWRWFS